MRPLTLLIVDDDAAFRSLQFLLFEGSEIRVLLSGGDRRSLELAAEADVALVDMVMPKPDGLDLIPLLRLENPKLKFMACSGASEDNFRVALNRLGVSSFLPKPFTHERILGEIEMLTGAVQAR